MRNLILSFGLLVVAACGGNSNAAPANDPSATSAAPATTETTTTTTSTEGATPGDGKCGAPTTTTSASSLDLCNAECEKLSDKAPEGSRCMPPRVECKQGCKMKFEKK